MTEIFDDIKSLYKFQEASAELKDYIDFFSESDLEKNAFLIEKNFMNVKLFPSFTPTIWINLGSEYQINSNLSNKIIHPQKDVLVLRATEIDRIILPTDHIFTIKFHPGAFEMIFGISQAIIANDIIDIAQLFSPSVIRKIKNMSGLEARVNEFETILLSRIKTTQYSKKNVLPIDLLVKEFKKSNMSMKREDFASRLYISEKTFYRRFCETIGTSPKNYFNILRARSALIAYESSYATFSPYDFGYFDYSHFSKDVKSFTGQTLSSFIL